jgi:hypothetical protein
VLHLGEAGGIHSAFLQVLGDEKYFARIIKTGVFPLFCECWKWFLAGGKCLFNWLFIRK